MDEENKELSLRQEAEEMEQLDLAIKDEPKLYIDYSELPFNRTGTRFLRDSPERAKLAIKLIALGFGNKTIGRRVHADPRTIKELRFMAIKDIEKQKELLRETIFPGVVLSAERAMEKLEDCNGKDAAIVHGILRDSYVQLSGLPTARIDVNHHVDVFGGLKELIQQAEEKMAKARVVEPLTIEDATT